MKIVILAGGTGTRLWPLSRSDSPKQAKPLFGQKTLLQRTVDRLLKGFGRKDISVVMSEAHRALILNQLPSFHRKQFFIEPECRNTSAAIGLAAYSIAKRSPRETIITIAADHYVREEEEFLRGLRAMEAVVRGNPKAVCLMGIRPTYPETGYGYIEIGRSSRLLAAERLYAIKRFVEKPPLGLAKKFVRSKKYLWNPSYFAWRVDRIQELFRTLVPATHRLLLQTVSGNRRAFKRIEAPAIDYAVLEKLRDNFFVLPVYFPWADVGHWASVREIQAKNTADNVQLGLQHNIDTRGSLIYNYTDKILATIGIEDLVIVQTEDGTLICRRDRAQDVKTLVERMRRERKLKRFL